MLLHDQEHLPFRAITLLAGFMMAESAEIGLLMGFVGSCKSMMTTCAVSPTFSRTQMNLSDSMVRVLNPMLAALIPILVSCVNCEKRSTDKCGIGKQNTSLQITSIDYGNLTYADNLNYSFKMQVVSFQATQNKLEKFLWNHVLVYHDWKLLIAKGVTWQVYVTWYPLQQF